MKFTKIAGLTTSVSLLFTALPALAATPQDVINNALKNYTTDVASHIVGEINVKIRETIWRATDKTGPETVNVSVKFDQRSLDKQDGIQNSEGRLTLSKFEIKTKDQSIILPQPVTINWKYVNHTIYGYVENVPQILVDALKNEVDLAPYLNQWYKTDLPQQASNILTGQAAQQINLANYLAKKLAEKQTVKVIKTEKTWTAANGDSMARVRIQANRTVLANDRLNKLKEAYKIKTLKDRRAAIAAINTEYATTLKELAKIQAVAEVNLTKNTVTRIEMSFAQSDTKKDCPLNIKTGKIVCRNIGVTNVNVMTGISILAADNTPIIVPADAKVFEPLQNLISGN